MKNIKYEIFKIQFGHHSPTEITSKEKKNKNQNNHDDVKVEEKINQEEEEEEEHFNQIEEKIKQFNDFQNLPETKLFKKIEQKAQSINPHLKNIKKENLKLSFSYSLTQKVMNQQPEVVKEMEQESQQFMKDVAEKIQNVQTQKKSLEQLNSNDQKDIAKAVLFQYYRQQGCNVQVTNKALNDQSQTNFYQTQLILTGQTDKLKVFDVHLEDKFYTYEKIISDQDVKKELLNKFIKATAKQYGVQEDQVTILDIRKGSVQIIAQIPQIQNQLSNNIGVDSYQKEFKDAKVSATVRSLIDNYSISDQYFDERYNMYWDSYHEDMVDYRGSLPKMGKGLYPQRYYFPVGFSGYGLDVQKWLKNDKKCFYSNEDNDVWIVLYNATNSEGFEGISSSYIKPGDRNFYGDSTCRLTGETIRDGSKENSYFSDRASGEDSSEDYGDTVQIGNKQYKLMFQYRVNPKHVRSPQERPTYYTVSKEYAEENVRPYRLLLREK